LFFVVVGVGGVVITGDIKRGILVVFGGVKIVESSREASLLASLSPALLREASQMSLLAIAFLAVTIFFPLIVA
jgi:hypothetical protein